MVAYILFTSYVVKINIFVITWEMAEHQQEKHLHNGKKKELSNGLIGFDR